MKKLTIKDIKSTSEKIYVRWSESIDLDKERGYSLRYGSSKEAGLSACEIDRTWADWRIIRQIEEYIFCGGSCWIIAGREVGLGGDNEPLLADVELVGKVSDEIINANLREMQKQEQIANCRHKLTRVTCPLAIKIYEDDLKKLLS